MGIDLAASGARPPGVTPVAQLVSATVATPDGRRLLGPLSLTLQAAEHWAVLGPNGAGKTTLLRLLAAERHPSTGTVEVLGQRLGATDVRALRTRVGVVSHAVADRLPQRSSALELVLTGKGGLLAPWWAMFDEADRSRALDLLARLGCKSIAGQPFGSCSQGERQRVLLARSLFVEHELLLLDEPAGGVDLPGREALVLALAALAGALAPPTTVQVSHGLEELAPTTTHALLLARGAVVAAGPVGEVLSDEPMGRCFGLPITVTRQGGRWSARAAASW